VTARAGPLGDAVARMLITSWSGIKVSSPSANTHSVPTDVRPADTKLQVSMCVPSVRVSDTCWPSKARSSVLVAVIHPPSLVWLLHS
jgi:hypothetical protein